MTSTGNDPDPDPDLGDTSSRGPDPSPSGGTGGGTGGDVGDPAGAGSPPGSVGLWLLLACGVVTTLTGALLTWWVWGQDRVNTYGWTAYTPQVGEQFETTWTDTARNVSTFLRQVDSCLLC